MNTQLYKHQSDGLEAVKDLNHVAFYWDMGLGKTYAGSEKIMQLGARVNLVVCQKSKVQDWLDHFNGNYKDESEMVYDLTSALALDTFLYTIGDFSMNWCRLVGVINYDLIWRRPELLKLENFTLLLDESSLIQNETAKRSKFILKMKPANVILLSGTPTGGKYEKLWSQMHLLGWNISKDLYWKQFVTVSYLDVAGASIPLVTGYKNVERLKRKMAEHGCQFLKTDEVFDMPAQTFQKIMVASTAEYKAFRKDRIITMDTGETLVGDTTLTRMLYERMLCSYYNKNKLQAFEDLLASASDRVVVFYNFNRELGAMVDICNKLEKPHSVINGTVKSLDKYEHRHSSVTFVQYQAGAMGLNLQKANKIIYFSLPLSSELFEQSKKRIHRIGQERPCIYYLMICKGSIEEKILATLEMRKDYTEALFEKDEER